MPVYFQIAAFYAFDREKEFSAMSSKNKVVDEKTPGQRQQFFKTTGFFGASQHMFWFFLFFRALVPKNLVLIC